MCPCGTFDLHVRSIVPLEAWTAPPQTQHSHARGITTVTSMLTPPYRLSNFFSLLNSARELLILWYSRIRACADNSYHLVVVFLVLLSETPRTRQLNPKQPNVSTRASTRRAFSRPGFPSSVLSAPCSNCFLNTALLPSLLYIHPHLPPLTTFLTL